MKGANYPHPGGNCLLKASFVFGIGTPGSFPNPHSFSYDKAAVDKL